MFKTQQTRKQLSLWYILSSSSLKYLVSVPLGYGFLELSFHTLGKTCRRLGVDGLASRSNLLSLGGGWKEKTDLQELI